MPKYIVTEVVDYEVEADSEEAAEEIITDAADRDKYVVAVRERDAELKDESVVYAENFRHPSEN